MSAKTAKTAPISTQLLDELQGALTNGTVARRVETLRRVTDLFMGQSVDYSSEQVAVFDDVFNCLVEHIEVGAKILLSERLAGNPMSPPRIIRRLAFDDKIEIAAPVLTQSERLDEETLVENARCKSQAHLLAISKRKTLSNAVTDVLVERGNDEVVESTVNNAGASFSEKSFSQLVERAERNDILAICLGSRKSIPRPHYLKLIARASNAVRARLEAANAGSANAISAAVSDAAKLVKPPAEMTREATAAHNLVQSLFADDRLDERQLMAFARAGKFDETNAAIACLADVPVSTVETVMIESRSEGVLVLAKVAGMPWDVVRAILDMRSDLTGGTGSGEIEISKEGYERLRTTTAQQVLRFYRMQQQTAAIEPVS